MTDTFDFEVPASTAHLGPGFGVLGLALDLTVRVLVTTTGGESHTVERRGATSERRIDPRHDTVLRALHEAVGRFDIKIPAGLRIITDSAIPPASGLGSQTAGFAVGLGVAVRFAKKRPSIHDLLSLLVELGGDPGHGVAALAGGLAAACQTSLPREPPAFRLLPQRVHESWQLVVVCPATRIATADTRRILPPTLPHAVTARTASRLVGLLQAMADGDEGALASFVFDEVHVPYRRRLVAGMTEAIAAGREAGAAGVTISGHGPGLIAMSTQGKIVKEIGEAMAQAFTAAGQRVEVLHRRIARHGAVPI